MGDLFRRTGLFIENGTSYWFLDGLIHREDGPAIIIPNGSEHWYQNGQLHRKGAPAIIHPNGREYWYFHDQCHREDGPAIIREDGSEFWYLNDVDITSQVVDWIERLGLKPWREWEDSEKTLFRISF